ncbi:MAG TPA: addiction module protein [Candidatus Limnocylindrales bacterium]|jgi:putative addiction module component (TIGR02574 family)|nr:addiction module protein [Candidatus Limnocylindrales bacterium]
MSAAELLEQAKALPLAERIELAQNLWEDIMDRYDPPLTQAEVELIDARLMEEAANPADVVSWTDLKAKLDEKFKK